RGRGRKRHGGGEAGADGPPSHAKGTTAARKSTSTGNGDGKPKPHRERAPRAAAKPAGTVAQSRAPAKPGLLRRIARLFGSN
ncbi:MAG: hypothetical protein WBQ57_04445, partial [Rhodanobacteraceae bacterium]